MHDMFLLQILHFQKEMCFKCYSIWKQQWAWRFYWFSMSTCLAINKISVHKGLYLWTNLSWGMKVQKASAIFIQSPPLIHDLFKNQTVPKWNQLHLLCSIYCFQEIIPSQKENPSSMSHHHLPKSGISLSVLWQLRVRPISVKVKGKLESFEKWT